MITARTRIYRQRPGRWVAVTIAPDGHRTRQVFASGLDALVALDARNRARTPLEAVSAALAEGYAAYVEMYRQLFHGVRSAMQARPEDFVLAPPSDGGAS